MEELSYHFLDNSLLENLLTDHSRPKHGKKSAHIIWATDNYQSLGPEYTESEQIYIKSITGDHGNIIQPRVRKTKEEQQSRVRDKGEVFTPAWICNAQNNLIDAQWFGSDSPFNKETDKGWETNPNPIKFPTKDGKTWQDYVTDIRLEVTCGEAPYLISRYDAITGDIIPVAERIGLLGRKLRVVAENTTTEEEWYAAAKLAYQATYGYEWQGDNLLLARENALYTFFDYYQDKFGKAPTKDQAREIAEIISWNFWQMDGLKGVIPNSCHEDVHVEQSLFGDGEEIRIPCKGCETDDIRHHNGIYAKIMDWEIGKPVRYIDLIKQ
ncbi:MAG: restriction endonuclease subunit M [Bacteroidales bacterium]|nr:restriction endonuclease subunit M [Bacteroidales bacterium]